MTREVAVWRVAGRKDTCISVHVQVARRDGVHRPREMPGGDRIQPNLIVRYHHKTLGSLIIRHPQDHPTWVGVASIFPFSALLILHFIRYIQVLPAQTLRNRCATRTLPQEAKVRARPSTR